jgi:hypothetical protein
MSCVKELKMWKAACPSPEAGTQPDSGAMAELWKISNFGMMLFGRPRTPKDRDSFAKLTSLIWTICVMPQGDRDEMVNDLCAGMPPEIVADFRTLVDDTLELHRMLWPDLHAEPREQRAARRVRRPAAQAI